MLKKLFWFGFVGGLGTIVNTLVLSIFTYYLSVHYLLSSVIATETAIIFNFIGNNLITFRNHPIKSSIKKRFLTFQAVSIFTLICTVALLWLFTHTFGTKLLLVWNFLAILITFIFNFVLNHKYTWKMPDSKTNRKKVRLAVFAIITMLVIPMVSAELVAVSQLGYHPDANKQVVFYTNNQTGSFQIIDFNTNNIMANLSLYKARDYNGNKTECQGNNPCLVGNFTNFKTEGTYYIKTSTGFSSPKFTISKEVFTTLSPTLLDFFNAQLQQNSDYHSDFHIGYDPSFDAIADGSFIMEADQAALPLIRLGSAYNRNPALFQTDNYDILSVGKPDMQEYIKVYVEYLKHLQGLEVQNRTDGVGFRLNPDVSPVNAFIPGPTNLTNLTYYSSDDNHSFNATIPLISLCGADDGTDTWDQCINNAAYYYKCQIDEPCLNMSYVEKTGTISNHNNGYAVSKGWGYEFGCFADINLNEELFNKQYDPCMIFYPETSRKYTSETLLAYLESLPAIYDYNQQEAQSLLQRSKSTHAYIKSNYPPFDANDPDTPYYGTSLFLLYDYTQNITYLQEAYNIRDKVSSTFVSDGTHGNEFYWEEYVEHRTSLESANLTYLLNGQDPAIFFSNKMWYDYKDAGQDKSISRNAERIFQFDNNIQFQNSRYMLTEGLLASKTLNLNNKTEDFMHVIANNQLAWLTGMNGVQDGVADKSPIVSYSFIFGVGNFPLQFHSRYLVNTNYSKDSNHKIIGARGTGLQFKVNDTNYQYLDGKFNILGQELGAMGNKWRNETSINPFVVNQTFANGQRYISGWITGAFDTTADNDIIFNYRDNLDTYEYTETTNEIVSTAIELISYQDARYNNRSSHSPLVFGGEINATLSVDSVPSQANISINGLPSGIGPQVFSLIPGIYNITLSKTGYFSNETSILLESEQQASLNLTLVKLPDDPKNGTLTIKTNPGTVKISLSNANKTYNNVTNNKGDLFLSEIIPGTYNITSSKANYITNISSITISDAQAANFSVTLMPMNATLKAYSNPSEANIHIIGQNRTIDDITPKNFSLVPGLYTITISKDGYLPNQTVKTLSANQVFTLNVTLTQLSNETKIINFSTDLSEIDDSPLGSQYHMFETDLAHFNVTLNQQDVVSWYINDTLIAQTPLSLEHQFPWLPGILYTSNLDQATITAIAGQSNVSFKVDVENVLNPFFQRIDDPTALIDVHTNNAAYNYSSVNVSIFQESTGITVTHALDSETFANNTETKWSKIINLEYGNNYLVQIMAVENDTQTLQTYNLTNERGEHRQPPGDNGGDGGKNNGGGGGGNGNNGPDKLEVIYVVLDKDVVDAKSSEKITLDAKSAKGQVTAVEAVFLTETGIRTERLALVTGTKAYGTWSTEIKNLEPGLHALQSIILHGSTNATGTIVPVSGRSFYVVSDIVNSNENLAIVYSILDSNKLEQGAPVKLRLDARDSTGVQSVTAHIEVSRGESFNIPLERVSGSPQYGTWEGIIQANKGDTTYSVKTITLSNGADSKTYPITERSVYVLTSAPVVTSFLTGSVIGARNLVKGPYFPTMVGFIVVFAILIASSIAIRLRRGRNNTV